MSSGDEHDQERLERIVSQPPPRGPKGEPGEPGKRGGLSVLQGRAVVVLFLIAALAGIADLFWTSHSVDVERGQWCALIVTLDQANAAAKVKPAPGSFAAEYAAEIHQRRQSLGCPAGTAAPGGTP